MLPWERSPPGRANVEAPIEFSVDGDSASPSRRQRRKSYWFLEETPNSEKAEETTFKVRRGSGLQLLGAINRKSNVSLIPDEIGGFSDSESDVDKGNDFESKEASTPAQSPGCYTLEPYMAYDLQRRKHRIIGKLKVRLGNAVTAGSSTSGRVTQLVIREGDNAGEILNLLRQKTKRRFGKGQAEKLKVDIKRILQAKRGKKQYVQLDSTVTPSVLVYKQSAEDHMPLRQTVLQAPSHEEQMHDVNSAASANIEDEGAASNSTETVLALKKKIDDLEQCNSRYFAEITRLRALNRAYARECKELREQANQPTSLPPPPSDLQ